MNTKAIIYSYPFAHENERAGISCDAQEAACAAFCEARGFDIVGTFREETATRAEAARRPRAALAIAEVRTFSASSPAVLVVHSIARIARTQRALLNLLFDARGVLPIASATEVFDTSTEAGRLAMGMFAVWTNLAPDLAPEAPPREAKRLGAPPMSELAPDAVKRIVELRREGLSHRAIAERLNAEGVKGGRGGQWWGKTVRAALAQAGIS